MIHHHYHLIIAHHRNIALGDFGNLNYYIRTRFIFDEIIFEKNLYYKNTLFLYLFISLLMYSQDVSVSALIDKFMFNPVYVSVTILLTPRHQF